MILIAGHAVPTAYEALTRHPKELDVVILLDPRTKMPSFINLAKSYICFEFYDTIYADAETSPQRHHIEEILKWSEGKENILVACHMGISRSSAIALLITVTKFGLDGAFDMLDPFKHSPNQLILKIGSEILNQPISEAYLDWVTKL